jgi:hypothetical protein
VITLSSLAISLACVQATGELPPSIATITPAMIQADVDHLADDSLYGRYWLSPFAQEAAEWIRDQFEAAGVHREESTEPGSNRSRRRTLRRT